MVGFFTITCGATFLGGCFPTVMREHGNLTGMLAVLCWLLVAVTGLVGNACLKCSECDASLHRAKGQYCPECGGHSLIDGDWWHPRRCGKCGLELHYGKGGRKFKVHYCSECGSYLDEKGL